MARMNDAPQDAAPLEDPEKTRAVPVEQLTTLLADDPSAGAQQEAAMAGIHKHYPVLEIRGGRGVSGMGVVYIVEDEGKLFAVKSFQPRFGRELAFVERFIRETRTWMLLGFHPNIVHAYRVDIIDAVPYLFMEYIPSDGTGKHSLADYLRAGALPLDTFLDFGLQLCEGMVHATAAVPGLVHRDLKPDNILLTPSGILKITDFGLVRAHGDSGEGLEILARAPTDSKSRRNITELGSVFGTPAYMAPEQFSSAAAVGLESDVYAVGCIFYEALAGRPPFRAEGDTTLEKIVSLKRQHIEAQPPSLGTIAPEIPEDLIVIVEKCLEKKPDHRWRSFGALQAALRDAALRHAPNALRPAACADAMPQQVAAQLRSLSLLDGYAQAVRLRHLRDHYAKSPYAFHLALASYFHCQNDRHEEERQLLRALSARGAEAGYEATRRAAELWLDAGRLPEAAKLLEAFLGRVPQGAGHVLEPLLRVLTLQGEFARAEAILAAQPEGPRTTLLAVELAEARGERAKARGLLEGQMRKSIHDIASALRAAQTGASLNWEHESDIALLERLWPALGADAPFQLPAETEQVIWPALSGEADLAAPMAWLSLAVGRLSVLSEECCPEEAARLRQIAVQLEYPARFSLHTERDEYWFWMQQALPISGRAHVT